MVRLCTDADDAEWDGFVNQCPAAHVYHLTAWRRIIERVFGHRAYYLASSDPLGQLDGVLPIVRLKSRLFGDFMVSMPYVNYGGPCSVSDDSWRPLTDEAVRLAAENRVAHLELRLTTPVALGLRTRVSKVAMRLNLPSSSDALWKAFPAKLRTQIKRAQQEDTSIRIGRHEELDSFYEVFTTNMRDLGTPVYGKRFFDAILGELPQARICSVYLRGEPVAAGFLIGFREVLEIPWASSLRRVSRLSPNMLLYWNVLKYGCDAGYTTFDFGRSSPDSGPYRFKQQWGALPLPLNWQYWVPAGGRLPDLSPSSPRYRVAVNIWRRLPVGLTRFLGPPIVSGLP